MSEKKHVQVSRTVSETIVKSPMGKYWVENADIFRRRATREEARECEAAGGCKQIYEKSWDLYGADLEAVVAKPAYAACPA